MSTATVCDDTVTVHETITRTYQNSHRKPSELEGIVSQASNDLREVEEEKRELAINVAVVPGRPRHAMILSELRSV